MAEERNLSVRKLFELLQEVRGGQRSNFLYERFLGKRSFDEMMRYLLQERDDVSRIYIGAHGDEEGKGIGWSESIRFSEIRNDLRTANSESLGSYVGSCFFGSTKTVHRFMKEVPALAWAAGYSKSVDWGDSSAIDLIFFRRLLQSTASSEADKGRRAAERVRDKCGGLAHDLGFCAAWRTQDGLIETIEC